MHLEDNILLVAEEISFLRDPELVAQLTDFITSSTLSVEIKNGPIRDVCSYSRVGITINGAYVVPASEDERRYTVFSVSDEHQGNKKYWADIVNELRNGGAEALMEYFMSYDISDFNCRQHFWTEELDDQKRNTLSGVNKWLYGVLYDGRLPLFDKVREDGTCQVITEKWQYDYQTFEKDPALRRDFDAGSFGKALHKAIPSIQRKEKIPNDTKYHLNSKAAYINVYTLPSLSVAREEFKASTNTQFEWDTAVEHWDAKLNWIIDGPLS